VARLIAEIGINFRGDIELAKRLIKHAQESGAWGVKFQYRNVDTFYQETTEIGDEIIINEIKKNSLDFESIQILEGYSKSLGLKFGMSYFRNDDLDLYLENMTEPDFIKIPSAECLNTDLVDRSLELGVEVIISTGGQDIDQVLEVYKNHTGKITLLHCIANYPAGLGAQNLAKIQRISQYFTAGYSSHDDDYLVCLLALGAGAEVIERHLTLDKEGVGLDDSSSSDVEEFKLLGRYVSNASSILGSASAPPNQGEILNMQNLGTGLYSKVDVSSGAEVNIDDFVVRAPRKGVSLGEFKLEFTGKILTKDVRAGEALSSNHFKDAVSLTEDDTQFASKHGLVIPVRLHDVDVIRNNVPAAGYEFHLSYTEALSGELLNAGREQPTDYRYSIHLPDYIPDNRILDPISDDLSVRGVSRKIISNVREMALLLSDKTGFSVPIVGSFSQLCGLEGESFVQNLMGYILEGNDVPIYPQWLPKYAWYFGGRVELDAFCNESYIELIEKYNIEICLDYCHLILSANAAGKKWREWEKRLIPYSRHIHIADAIGYDSEGLKFGDGVLDGYQEILRSDGLKVIETWQAHLNDGAGFIDGIKDLRRMYK